VASGHARVFELFFWPTFFAINRLPAMVYVQFPRYAPMRAYALLPSDSPLPTHDSPHHLDKMADSRIHFLHQQMVYQLFTIPTRLSTA